MLDMDQADRYEPELLDWWSSLSVEDRIRQANAAFRLCHALHHPFAKPFYRGFDRIEEFFEFEKGLDLPR